MKLDPDASARRVAQDLIHLAERMGHGRDGWLDGLVAEFAELERTSTAWACWPVFAKLDEMHVDASVAGYWTAMQVHDAAAECGVITELRPLHQMWTAIYKGEPA